MFTASSRNTPWRSLKPGEAARTWILVHHLPISWRRELHHGIKGSGLGLRKHAGESQDIVEAADMDQWKLMLFQML